MIIAVFLITLFTLLFLGMPIAFCLIVTALVMMLYLGFDLSQFIVIPQTLIDGADSFALMSIPFFILAGELMNHSGMSMRIINFSNALIGWLRGGIGYASTVAGMFFAGVSGTAVADTAALGSVLLPVMDKDGYDRKTSTSLICASGSTGPIIPPSYPMILYGVISGVSIGALFIGGIIPGLMLGFGVMIAWTFIVRKRTNNLKDCEEEVALTNNSQSDLLNEFIGSYEFSLKLVWRTFKDAFWGLLMPVIIMGGIISGVFTPTESAVVAVFYAFFIGTFVYRSLDFKVLPQVFLVSAKQTAIVQFIAATGICVGYFITISGMPNDLANMLLAITTNPTMLIILICLLLILVGCVLDLTPAMLIFAPIFVPIMSSMGVDLVYFGVIMVFVLCLGLITPPVGAVLFVGAGLSGLNIIDLAKGMIPYLVVMVVILILLIFMPNLVLYLPTMLYD